MTINLTLTQLAQKQAGEHADEVLGMAHGEIDRREGWEPHNLGMHAFEAYRKWYVMYPVDSGELMVDACEWYEIELTGVPEDHPLHGEIVSMPRPASTDWEGLPDIAWREQR